METKDGVHFAHVDGENTRHIRDLPEEKNKMTVMKEIDIESMYDKEAPGVHEGDFKQKQVFRGWVLLWLAYQSTGVIYGDIGTSPLYVYSSTFSSEPSYENLVGALSLIIWSITLIVTIKYVLIVLCADDEGEGGTFAIYNLLARFSNITKRDPKTENMVKLERHLSDQLQPSNRTVRNVIERSRVAHALLKVLAVFGVSLILADSILTPAQSVLGAVQGLKVVTPSIGTDTVVGVSCAILIVLFLLQPFGIHKLASCFAPVVIVWLLFNLVFGIYNLVYYDHSVLKAFSPYFAGQYFIRNKYDGWVSLGGILLCFTGVEALFADMGAFTKSAVQISWLFLAYPCLLIAYIGQAAYISRIPSAYSNPFFNTVPDGLLYPSLVISILAAIVASQAMITSTFQLLSQVMNTSYFPQIKMIYTSDRFHGQVYIPAANWLMMLGTVVVTAVYNNTTKLGHAYGFCVILVTFITTCLVSLVGLIVWRLNWFLVFAVWLTFITLDGLYLSSSVIKLPDGAWFTLLLAVILSSFFVLWRYGKESQWKSERKKNVRLTQLVTKTEDRKVRLADQYGGAELTTIKGLGIFFDKSGDMVPTVYEEFLRKFEAQQEVHVFLHMRALSKPHVAEDEAYTVSRTSISNCYRLIIRHGYNDRVVSPNLANIVYEQLRHYIATSPPTPHHASSSSSEPIDIHSTSAATLAPRTVDALCESDISRRVHLLDAAYAKQVVYVVGKEELRLLVEKNNRLKRMVLGVFLWVRSNSRSRIAQMRVPVEKLVEVGFVREI